MKYFVLVYNSKTGELRMSEFADRDAALALRIEREDRYRGEPDVEVVVIAAHSLDEIKQSHSRYFMNVAKNFSLSGDYELEENPAA